MQSGRLAGIDFGTVRIGIAITDSRQTLASPYQNYNRASPAADAEYFRRLVKDEGVQAFVVGLPVHLSGKESQKSIEARAFGQWLAAATGLSVYYFDERFTSREALAQLETAEMTKKKRKARLDMVAAQIMLTGYLESSRQDAAEPQGLDD
jgi:putative Holliday junction resolvase